MLQMRLLGQFDIRLEGKRVLVPTRAGQSLLAYFAMTAGTVHRREKLAGMFWPDTSEEAARKNLRQELWRIRKAISAQKAGGNEYLRAEDLTITFNPHAEYWLDVAQFERSGPDLESLTHGLSLYQGELLPGFYDDWILPERERIRSIFDRKMEQLLAHLIAAERWTAAQEQAERWLALGSSLEPAYRALMLAYGARGDMAKVSTTYQQCMAVLDEQLGLEPSAETRALYDGLLKGSHVSARSRTLQTSGTVTFLFTDIEASTHLLEQLGDQYAAVLAEHHQILRASIQKWNGREVDTQGDAFFVTFARSMDAVQCAAEVQRALVSHPWPQDHPLRVRMGLHTGEPLIASTGYVGMDVHRAARIGDAAHGGQVLLSQTTRELVMHGLPEGLGIRDLGEHRLKDLKYPTPIYQLVIDGVPQDFPALRTKFTGTEAPTPGMPPFKGLQYFEEADAELFFGRELLTAKLVNRLQQTFFLSVIIGASGSGKSSLVRAGVIPALKKGEPLLDGTQPPLGSEDWHIYILTPTARPLEALAIKLTRSSESVTAAATLMDDMLQDSRSLAFYLARQYPGEHTLLVLDQFEELFTLCRDEFEREAFIDNLLATIQPGEDRITLMITLRADFYAYLAQYPELREAVARQQEYIGPMTMEELRRAIEEPARRAHWEFEPGLVDLILRDIGEEPGALPLLSHALLETWKRRAGHTLTLKGYAEAGGVRGAIAHTAETLYQSLPAEEQALARDIFLRLTELGEGTEDTRRRASFEELFSHTDSPEEVRLVLNALAEARLVTLSEDTAEVAHEALIREWPTLREWLNQDREGLLLHRRLTEAAYEWELLGRDPGALYRGAHLAQAYEWSLLHSQALNAGERTFLEASLELEQREQTERQEQQQRELETARRLLETEKARTEEQAHSANRLRIRNRIITAAGLVTLILAIVAVLFGEQSNLHAAQAQTNLGIANQQKAAALNAQATAMAESQIRATQQAVAESNFRQGEAQRLAAEASKLLASQGSPELIALLSLRSMNTQYTPQGDAALTAAARLNYPKRLFFSQNTPINAVAFSPDNKYIFIGDEGSLSTLWNASTGEMIQTFSGHSAIVLGAAYSPDGRYLLTGSWDTTAILWEVATGKAIQKFKGHTQPVASVAFSPDGKSVLTGSLDGTARLWEPVTGRELRRFIPHADVVRSVAFSPDGKYALLGVSDGTASLWNIETGAEVRRFTGHTSGINAAAFSPDGKLILTGGYDFIARIWEVASGRELQDFVGHTNAINAVAFSPDGSYIFTGSDDGTARKWDLQSGRELERYIGPVSLGTIASMPIAISPDGQWIVSASSEGETRLWTIDPSPKLPVFRNTGIVNAVAFSPGGKTVVTGDSSGALRLWDVVSGRKLREFVGHTDLINYGAAFSPDGKTLLTGSWDRTVRLWDIQTGQELRTFDGPIDSVHSVAFSPDGKYVAAGGEDGVWLWAAGTGQQVFHLENLKPVIRVAFSPDGRYIAIVGQTASGQNQVRVWDVSTPKSDSFLVDFPAISTVAFSSDGKQILTAGEDNTAKLWDLQMHKRIRTFTGHSSDIRTAVFSPDNRYVATASADGTVRLWDTQTGKELRRFIGHTAAVENVVFSPDGQYLLSGSDDGTAMLWDVDYHTTVQYLCQVLLRDFTLAERTQYAIRDRAPTCPKP